MADDASTMPERAVFSLGTGMGLARWFGGLAQRFKKEGRILRWDEYVAAAKARIEDMNCQFVELTNGPFRLRYRVGETTVTLTAHARRVDVEAKTMVSMPLMEEKEVTR